MYFTIPSSTGIVGTNTIITVDKGAEKESSPRVLKARFGDGYMQRLPDGLNTLAQKINFSFSPREKAEIDIIDRYLEYLGGFDTLTLTVPRTGGDLSIKCIVESWRVNYAYDNFYTLTASAERVYE